MKRICKVISLFFLFFIFINAIGIAQTIPVQTTNVALALQVDGQKRLKITHFGKPLQNIAEYEMAASVYDRREEGANNLNLAFTVAGINANMAEPAIAVVHADGNNSLDLVYDNHTVTNTPDGAVLTTVTLKDGVYPFTVQLFYKAWQHEDVIEQWSSIRHSEKGNVMLNKYASANLYFFNRDYFTGMSCSITASAGGTFTSKFSLPEAMVPITLPVKKSVTR